MEKIINPDKSTWKMLLQRPKCNYDDLQQTCKTVFAEVMKDGDAALARYTRIFDNVDIAVLEVTPQEFEACENAVSAELKAAILAAKANISAFHACQIPAPCEYVNENGFKCWQEARAIEKVGLYIPGGSAPLFSTVLMLAEPARLAGCKDIIMCTPPGKNGRVEPAILWAARQCGVTKVYKVGGIQAIAAMTFGTQTIAPVYKIFGPGNRYVTAAKQMACNFGVAIDMPAGPSELMVVADRSASPAYVAADLLSQAEHGRDSQVFLVTWCEELLAGVERELAQQLAELPRKEIAEGALANSRFIVLNDRDTCMELVNEYAPEHLVLSIENYRDVIPCIQNAGSVFLGNYSPESAGDYASGTNHTLPTSGYAKAYSGVNMDAFIKKVTFQEISREGLAYLGKTIEVMAENEQLFAHRNAVSRRLADI